MVSSTPPITGWALALAQLLGETLPPVPALPGRVYVSSIREQDEGTRCRFVVKSSYPDTRVEPLAHQAPAQVCEFFTGRQEEPMT